jgi:hypothetical protein
MSHVTRHTSQKNALRMLNQALEAKDKSVMSYSSFPSPRHPPLLTRRTHGGSPDKLKVIDAGFFSAAETPGKPSESEAAAAAAAAPEPWKQFHPLKHRPYYPVHKSRETEVPSQDEECWSNAEHPADEGDIFPRYDASDSGFLATLSHDDDDDDYDWFFNP